MGSGQVFLVLYLSWIPDPAMKKVGWLPEWLSGWADENATLRTGVPFVLLGLLAGGWLIRKRSGCIAWLVALAALLLLVLVAEAGQLLIPRRVFDWEDIAWGACGAGVGLGGAGCFHAWRWRRENKQLSAPAPKTPEVAPPDESGN